MKKINILAILLFCTLSVSAESLDIFSYSTEGHGATEDVSLVGTSWFNRNKELYFTLVFISDNKVFQEGDYDGYGGYQCTYYYFFDGRKGEVRLINEDNSAGKKVGEFIVTKDSAGNPSTLILTTYSMEPGDGGEQFFLSIQY
ncbi:MAG: hypothetical protein K6F96_08745 [Bacteroidales bacterium]|nr:hypothetical protein [Bacteroidales bacterium]